jgi:hypothetical protein
MARNAPVHSPNAKTSASLIVQSLA